LISRSLFFSFLHLVNISFSINVTSGSKLYYFLYVLYFDFSVFTNHLESKIFYLQVSCNIFCIANNQFLDITYGIGSVLHFLAGCTLMFTLCKLVVV
jgi:hypothetical protein